MAQKTAATQKHEKASGAGTHQPEAAFEDMMQRLDEIVAALDEDATPLEASIALYEEGIALVERCALALKGAETRLKELRRRADGVFETIDAREAEL